MGINWPRAVLLLSFLNTDDEENASAEETTTVKEKSRGSFMCASQCWEDCILPVIEVCILCVFHATQKVIERVVLPVTVEVLLRCCIFSISISWLSPTVSSHCIVRGVVSGGDPSLCMISVDSPCPVLSLSLFDAKHSECTGIFSSSLFDSVSVHLLDDASSSS